MQKTLLFIFLLLINIKANAEVVSGQEPPGLYQASDSIQRRVKYPTKKQRPQIKQRVSRHTRTPLRVIINKRTQTMRVMGPINATWSVSTGSKGPTPNGTYRAKPATLNDSYVTRKTYHGKHVRLPHAIRVVGGILIHTGRGLGKPTSHGCIHLADANAKLLYDQIKVSGEAIVTII